MLEKQVVQIAFEYPAYGQQRACNELKKKGFHLSPGGVRGIWLRHDLETFKKRLKALEAKVAQEGIILTESQLTAMEKAKVEIPEQSDHLLCWNYQRCWQNISTNIHRYLL